MVRTCAFTRGVSSIHNLYISNSLASKLAVVVAVTVIAVIMYAMGVCFFALGGLPRE